MKFENPRREIFPFSLFEVWVRKNNGGHCSNFGFAKKFLWKFAYQILKGFIEVVENSKERYFKMTPINLKAIGNWISKSFLHKNLETFSFLGLKSPGKTGSNRFQIFVYDWVAMTTTARILTAASMPTASRLKLEIGTEVDLE